MCVCVCKDCGVFIKKPGLFYLPTFTFLVLKF